MKIKVCITNKDKIETELKAVNGRAESFTFTDYSEVQHIALFAEYKFQRTNVPKHMRKGATVSADSGGYKLPRSYKYKRKVTHITLYRGKDDWFIVGISAAFLYPNESMNSTLYMTQRQKSRAVSEFKKTLYSIHV